MERLKIATYWGNVVFVCVARQRPSRPAPPPPAPLATLLKLCEKSITHRRSAPAVPSPPSRPTIKQSAPSMIFLRVFRLTVYPAAVRLGMRHALLVSLSGGLQGQAVQRIVASVIVGRGTGIVAAAGHSGEKCYSVHRNLVRLQSSAR